MVLSPTNRSYLEGWLELQWKLEQLTSVPDKDYNHAVERLANFATQNRVIWPGDKRNHGAVSVLAELW
jgi:hypothetical protein